MNLTHTMGQAAGVLPQPVLVLTGECCWRQRACARVPCTPVYLASGQEWPEKAGAESQGLGSCSLRDVAGGQGGMPFIGDNFLLLVT